MAERDRGNTLLAAAADIMRAPSGLNPEAQATVAALLREHIDEGTILTEEQKTIAEALIREATTPISEAEA